MSSDNELKKAVLDELSWEPGVDAAHIGVTAHAGVVTLTGHVGTLAQKLVAEKATSRVRGVRGMAEEIEVKLPYAATRSDEDIAMAAIERLRWNTMVPLDTVQVRVSKGWVTLTGTVTWNFEKEAAQRDIQTLSGVIGFSNNIVLNPAVNASNVKDEIERAFRRSWFYDPNTINVSVHGGEITLSGEVSSWNARKIAGSTAWSAPGATSIENDIVVKS